MTYAGAYIIVLAVFTVSCLIIKPKKPLPFFLILDFIIAIPSYFTKTPDGMYYDQDRFNLLLNVIRGYNRTSLVNGLNWSLNQSDYANEPGAAVYVWFFSLFKNNGVLRLGTTFIFLALLTILIIKVTKQIKIYNVETIFIVQLLLLLTFNMFYEISGIRNFLAFMIFAVSFYAEINEKKKRNKIKYFIFYLIAYSIHSSILPFIVLRLVLLINNRFVNICTYVFLLTYNLYLSSILQFLNRFTLFNFFTSKANFYVDMQEQSINFSSNADNIVMTLIFLSLIVELLIFKHIYDKNMMPKYLTYYNFVLFYIIGSISITQVYIRTIFFLLFLSVPLKTILFSNSINVLKGSDLLKVYRTGIILFALSVFVLWLSLYYVNVWIQ